MSCRRGRPRAGTTKKAAAVSRPAVARCSASVKQFGGGSRMRCTRVPAAGVAPVADPGIAQDRGQPEAVKVLSPSPCVHASHVWKWFLAFPSIILYKNKNHY